MILKRDSRLRSAVDAHPFLTVGWSKYLQK